MTQIHQCADRSVLRNALNLICKNNRIFSVFSVETENDFEELLVSDMCLQSFGITLSEHYWSKKDGGERMASREDGHCWTKYTCFYVRGPVLGEHMRMFPTRWKILRRILFTKTTSPRNSSGDL